jgi:hypothetical protein
MKYYSDEDDDDYKVTPFAIIRALATYTFL